ncbi:MAG: type IX secretion system protein PorQ [Saprospiraceae bacterium]|nr:type IX secretion system protein PorQ [Saprospiraceae bacterium]MDW8482716.1 type IX secretion system protein PorQ [Saprospiraceae bacterium]
MTIRFLQTTTSALWISLPLLVSLSLPTVAQVTGGRHAFKFLTLSPSARITALGGLHISVRDDDVALAALNPAALNPRMSGRLSLQHNFLLANIQHSYAAYAHHAKIFNATLHASIQHVNYGDIPRADAFGNVQGEVRATETAFTLGIARLLTPKWSLGLNVRFARSALDMYQATALSSDVGVLYEDTARLFSAAAVVRQLGTQLTLYRDTREALPFDLQLAVSKRLRYLPFRLSIVAHHLHQWNIRYDDPALRPRNPLLFGGDQPTEGNPTIDNFFRHLIFNGEFLLGANEFFRIRLGYNHLRRRELTVRNFRSLAGFSAGLGLRVSRFRIDLGYASYHIAGGIVHFGLSTNVRELF